MGEIKRAGAGEKGDESARETLIIPFSLAFLYYFLAVSPLKEPLWRRDR